MALCTCTGTSQALGTWHAALTLAHTHHTCTRHPATGGVVVSLNSKIHEILDFFAGTIVRSSILTSSWSSTLGICAKRTSNSGPYLCTQICWSKIHTRCAHSFFHEIPTTNLLLLLLLKHNDHRNMNFEEISNVFILKVSYVNTARHI